MVTAAYPSGLAAVDLTDVSAGRDINIVYNGPAPDTAERRNLSILLARVRHFWVEGVLEKSVPKDLHLELRKEEVPDAVEHPWGQVVELPSGRGAVSDSQIDDIFQQAEQSLLILGEAGSGKTITLLDLAQCLIERAERDPAAPIPVILQLASWTDTGRPLIDWVVAELSNKYQVPRRMGQEWLERMRLLMMLDGLDEVRIRDQLRCIEAINKFSEQYGLVGLVVCSREREYALLPVRLKLRRAISLRPLTKDQIDGYIAGTSSQGEALQALLGQDSALRAEAESPLMLNIMCYSYAGADSKQADEPRPTPDPPHGQLFDSYIERMFRRKGRAPYSTEETMQCLRWLAQSMVWQNQSIFLIERLQTDWLRRRMERYLNLMIFGVVFGVLVGLIGWAFWNSIKVLYGSSNPQVSSYLLQSIEGYPLAVWLVACTIWVLGIGLLDVLYYELTHRWQTPAFAFSRWVDCTKLLVSVPIWAGIWWGAASWNWGPDFSTGRLTVPYVTGLIVCLLVGVWGIGRQSLAVDIRTVEALRWSWIGVLKGLIVGVLVGFVLWLVWMLVNNLEFDLSRLSVAIGQMRTDHWFTKFLMLFALLGGGTGAILMGFTGTIVEGKDWPNQGIKLSLRSASLAGLTSGVCLGTLFALMMWGFLKLEIGSAIWAGVSLGFVFMSVAVFWHGGVDVLKHYILRAFLFFRGYTPRHFTEFLDHTTDLILLQRVGGGYIFIHRLLLEHIAGLASGQRQPYTLL